MAKKKRTNSTREASTLFFEELRDWQKGIEWKNGFRAKLKVLLDASENRPSQLSPRRICLIAYYILTVESSGKTHTELYAEIAHSVGARIPSRKSWGDVNRASTRKSRNLPGDIEAIRSTLSSYSKALALAEKEAEEVSSR